MIGCQFTCSLLLAAQNKVVKLSQRQCKSRHTCTSPTHDWKAAARCRLFQRLATVLVICALRCRPCTQVRHPCHAAVRCRLVQRAARLSPSWCHLCRCASHCRQPRRPLRCSQNAAKADARSWRGRSQDTAAHSRSTEDASLRAAPLRKVLTLPAAHRSLCAHNFQATKHLHHQSNRVASILIACTSTHFEYKTTTGHNLQLAANAEHSSTNRPTHLALCVAAQRCTAMRPRFLRRTRCLQVSNAPHSWS